MTDLYETNLWGKIDYLHERYQREHNHISNFLDMISKFQIACADFSKAILSILNKNYILSESNTSTIYQSMENFYKTLLIHSESFKETSESIKINTLPLMKSISDSFQKEKELYNTYIKSRTAYINSKNNLKRIQKEFASKARECESKVYDAKRASLYKDLLPEQIAKLEQQASESLANTALCEDKYIQILNETNKARESEINLQKKLQSYYYNIDIDYYGKEKMMTGFFISCLKRTYNAINNEIIDLNEKYKNINIEKDINEFIKINKVNTKPDDIIKFIPYKPATEISDESILNANFIKKNKESKSLEVSLEVILLFQKFFKFIRTDLDMEKERKKSKLRILSYKIFWPVENTFLEPKEKNALFNLFKESIFISYFLTILSRQRTKGFKKNEKLLDDLIEIFNKILEIAEKEKNYDIAINCVILSQTYFCEKKGKNGEMEKKFILDGIRDNKWLSSFEFWEGVINLMIEREIQKNDEINKDNKDEKEKEKEKKINNNNIAFSQILSHANNMIEFNINKEGIYSFINKLCEKYELNQEMINSITTNINKKFEEKDGAIIEEKKDEKIENIDKEKIFEKEDMKEENEKVNLKNEDNEGKDKIEKNDNIEENKDEVKQDNIDKKENKEELNEEKEEKQE